MKTILLLFCLILVITNSNLYSQQLTNEDSITVSAGANYSANGLHELFFGEHWRDIWTTSVKVKVLDINKYDGGLSPLKEGGGQQTKTLHFINKNGKKWKFRSVDKDPTEILPSYLRESVAENILKDQVSSANPFAPLIVPVLLDAVGVLQVKPTLVFLQDDAALGEYREKFGEMLGYIEENPDEGVTSIPNLKNASDLKGTYKLLDKMEKDFAVKFASTGYLKARLIDLLVGDWDRHMEQWDWALLDGENGSEWFPIPKDRDQAFSKFDGVFPSVAAFYTTPLNGFNDEFPSIRDLTWNGRFLDRRVLTEMNKTIWDSVTSDVINKITDQVIKNSVKTLPPEIYPIAKDEIEFKLIKRKNLLKEAADLFYKEVNKYADVFCSKEDDFVEVNRIDNNFTRVKVFKMKKASNEKEDEPYFSKLFDNNITVDIRIHLNDGDDKAYVHGECDESPIVRIIGEDGKDQLIDNSIVHGYFLSITPFKVAQNKTYFFDSGNKTEIISGGGTVYDDSKVPEPKDEFEKYEPGQLDRGHFWVPLPVLGYETTKGVIIGGSLQLHKYNFRQIPKEYKQEIELKYFTSLEKIAVNYEGEFYSILKNSRFNLNVSVNDHLTTRYYGYGNETNFDESLEEIDFYDVNQDLLTFSPTFHYNFSDFFSTSLGLSFIYSKTRLNNSVLLSDAKFGDFGIGKLNPLGFNLGFEFSKLADNRGTANGYTLKVNGSFFPSVFNIPRSFSLIDVDLKAYYSPKTVSGLTLALRAGGKRVWGRYPFFVSATLGATENLRGYQEKRFSGDASLFGQTELRMFLTNMNLILKSKLGAAVFAEAGRVFISNQSSSVWHPSYGFGLWISYLDSRLIFSSYVAFSTESTLFSIGTGIAF